MLLSAAALLAGCHADGTTHAGNNARSAQVEQSDGEFDPWGEDEKHEQRQTNESADSWW